jgi:hypothetical protein
MKNLNQARKLIAEDCANHQRIGPLGIKNYCWAKEKSNAGICVFFTDDSPECSYFEEAVLPLDEDLKKSMEERKDAGTEDGATHSGSGPIQGSESGPGNPAKVSVKRVSVDQYRGPGILPRARIHGMASQKPENGR